MGRHRRSAWAAVALAAGVALWTQTLRATALTWDADAAGPNTGGSGTWDTTSALWFNGTSYVAWSNNNDAVLGGTAGTLTLGTTITANSITFNTNDYIIDLNGKGTPGLKTNTAVNFGAGVDWATITATTAATYQAVAQTSNGTSGRLKLAGLATMQFIPASGQSATDNRNIELVGTTQHMNVSGSNAVTLTGQISGSGNLDLSNSQGELVLAGNNNSYSGATTITGAGPALVVGSSSGLGNTTSISVNGASTFGLQGGINLGAYSLNLNAAAPIAGVGMLHNFSGDNSFAGAISLGFNTLRTFGAESGSSLLLTGVISNVRGLTKIGGGTIILSGANTYGTSSTATIAGTNVNDGVLRLDFSQTGAPSQDIINNGNLSITLTTGSSQLVLGGGTLEVQGKSGATNSQQFKNNTSNGFTINPGASVVKAVQNGASSLTINLGKLAATSRLVGGTVDFTLPTTGAIVLPSGGIGTASTILTANGAAFATVGANDWAAKDSSNTNIVGGSSISGFYTASTASSLSGNADVAAGVDTNLASSTTVASLRFNDQSARTITNASGQPLTTGGILVTSTVGNNVSTITGGSLQGASGIANQDLVVFQNNPSAALTIGSQIVNNVSGTGLTKSGAGTLELTAANSYSGATSVNAGVLKLSNASALGGGNLALHGGVVGLTSASGDFTRALGTSAGQVQWLGGGGFAAYGANSRAVNLGGASAQVIWGNTVSADGSINFVPGGSKLILGAADADAMIDFQNPIRLYAKNPTIPLNRTIQVDNGSAATDARISGVLSDVAGINKTGAGTLELSATNIYLGPTNVNAGALLLSGSTASSSLVNVATAGTLAGTGTVNGSATLTGSGAINFSSTGNIAAALAVSGGNWNGLGSVGGAITSSSGTFTIGSGANLTANGGLNVTGGSIAAGDVTSTITGNVNYTSPASSSFAGVIAGATKTLTLNNAAATLTLSGTNTYSGNATVSAGTLVVATGGSIANSAVTVSGSGVIGGGGTTGALAINSGGTLSPGTSVGQLNAASSTWQGGGIYTWEISDAAGTAGSGYDQLNLTGGLTISATAASKFAVQIIGLAVQNLTDGQTFVIAHSGTSVAGFDPAAFMLSVTDAGDSDAWSIEQSADGHDLRLRFAVVPEPASAVLLAAASIGSVMRRRRRRSI